MRILSSNSAVTHCHSSSCFRTQRRNLAYSILDSNHRVNQSLKNVIISKKMSHPTYAAIVNKLLLLQLSGLRAGGG